MGFNIIMVLRGKLKENARFIARSRGREKRLSGDARRGDGKATDRSKQKRRTDFHWTCQTIIYDREKRHSLTKMGLHSSRKK